MTQNATFIDRLREVVAYENRRTGGLFLEEVPTHMIFGRKQPIFGDATTGFPDK